jgi:Domain of unknown function (DUF6378)
MATKISKVRQSVLNALNAEAAPSTARQQILDEASEATHGDRNLNYGNPEDNFKNIASLWTGYLRAKFGPNALITEHDVPILNMLQKIARLANSPGHHDSCVDIAGYAACLGDIQAAATPAWSKAVGLGQVSEEQIKEFHHNHATAMKGSFRR